jgi:hypothetical protein
MALMLCERGIRVSHVTIAKDYRDLTRSRPPGGVAMLG